MANVISILIQAKDEASRVLAGVRDNVSRIGPSFEQSATASRGLALGLGAVAASAGGLLSYGTHVAGNLESWKQGFVTLLGSTEQANAALKMIARDAASTPFEMTGLVQANLLLTSITKDAGKSETLLLNVGKALAAMGKGQPELDRIIVNLQQIGATGRATMVDIRQFAYNGIPIFEMLAQATGKSGEALEEFISGGGVTFDMLTDMFNKAGSAGGRFANAFTNQAGTFNQLVSNMKDNFAIFVSQVVTQTGLFDIVKAALSSLIGFMQAHQEDLVAGIRGFFTFIRENAPIVVGVLVGALAPAFLSLVGTIAAATFALTPWIAAGAAVAVGVQLLVAHFGGLRETIAGLTPYVQFAREVVLSFLGSLNQLAQSIWSGTLPVLVELRNWFINLPPAVQAAINPFLAFGFHLGETRTFIGQVTENLRNLWATFSQSTPVIIAGQYLSQVFWPGLQAVIAAVVQNLLPALSQLWASFVRLYQALEPALTTVLRLLATHIGVLLVASSYAAVTALNIVIQIIAGLVSAISNLIGWLSNLISWVGNLVGAWVNGWSTMITIARNFVPAVMTVVSIIGSAFAGLGSTIVGAFRGAFDAVVNLFSGLPSRIVGSIGNIGGRLRDAIGSIDIPGPLGRVKDVIPGFALGTNYAPGGLAVVGEHGPEVVNLPRGSKVYSSQQSQDLAQAGGVTNILSGNFTFQNAEAVSEFFSRLDKTQRLARMGAA